MLTPDPRAWVKSPRFWGALVVLALLVVSVRSFVLIPGWGKPWGLDLRNVYVFHACSGRDDPYLVTGRMCGDPYGRAMPYPPLMYWALVWMRWVSFESARWIWASFITAALLLAAAIWPSPEAPLARLEERWPALAFGVLLITQFPAAFSIERGNNDTFVVFLWTLAMVAFASRKLGIAGALAGLAAAAKLYPAFSCVVVAAGLLGAVVRGAVSRANALRFAAGLVLPPLLVTLVFRAQTEHYLREVLPAFAAHLPGVSTHSHSVPATFGAAARAVSALVIVAWIAAAFRRFEQAPAEVFAGALAVSTYVAGTSFDYNLVTTYPLLIVLAARALSRPRGARWDFVVLVLGLLAITAHRGWFATQPVAHVALQIAWLVAAAALIGAGHPERAAT